MNTATLHTKRKNTRLKDYDYSSDGYYFVTICTDNSKRLVEEHRQKIEEVLLSLPKRFAGLGIDYYVLMPTHIHVIFEYHGVGISLGRVVQTFKAFVTRASGIGSFWQRNYYEHVIRSEQALAKIREYIQNNPLVDRVEFEQFYKD